MKQGMFKGASVAVVVLLLSGFFHKLDPVEVNNKIISFVNKNRVQMSSDVWIEKHNFIGEWEKMALVFGYVDNYTFCQEVVKMYTDKYSSDTYRCTPVN